MANVDYILKLSEQFCKTINPFDIREFDSLQVFDLKRNVGISEERNKLLEQILFIGKGGSRNTYALSTRKALKVAKDHRGLEGNKNEFEFLSNNQSLLLPKAYDHAEDYSWIIVELVRPISSSDEISELIGINGKLLLDLMDYRHLKPSFDELLISKIHDLKKMIGASSKNTAYNFANKYLIQIKELQNLIGNPYLAELDRLIENLNLEPRELSFYENFGKSASGHLVLLDIGATKKE